MDRFKVGDFVKVAWGPAYAGPGSPVVKGRVEAIEPGGVVMVRVTSGGLWGFNIGDLKQLTKAQDAKVGVEGKGREK